MATYAPAPRLVRGSVGRAAGPAPTRSGARPDLRPGSAGAARPAGTGLRLTRRGRVVLCVGAMVLTALAMTLVLLLVSRPAQAGAGPVVPVRHHVVLPGETLWSIAARLVPGQDPRDAIVLIEQINGLAGPGVVAGQRLALPAAG